MSRCTRRHSAEPSRSTHVIAVKGSLTPGESARAAISTSWFTANSISWAGVRWFPNTNAEFTRATSGSVTRSPGQTIAIGLPRTTYCPGRRSSRTSASTSAPNATSVSRSMSWT